MSAYLNAVYSYFEIKALAAHTAYPDPEIGEYIEGQDMLSILRQYVRIDQNRKNPSFVKTSALDGCLETLYELRKKNTHHYPRNYEVESCPSRGISLRLLKEQKHTSTRVL